MAYVAHCYSQLNLIYLYNIRYFELRLNLSVRGSIPVLYAGRMNICENGQAATVQRKFIIVILYNMHKNYLSNHFIQRYRERKQLPLCAKIFSFQKL